MKKFKSAIGCLFLLGMLSLTACNSSNTENDEGTDYTDTVESNVVDDNNMRNDQPTDELTQKKDSLSQDTLIRDTSGMK